MSNESVTNSFDAGNGGNILYTPTTDEQLVYLVNVKQQNGTSPFLHLNVEETGNLNFMPNPEGSINVYEPTQKSFSNINEFASTNIVESTENSSTVVNALDSTRNMGRNNLHQIVEALGLDENVPVYKNPITYRIVYPEELQLKRTTTKRGRPKRKPKLDEKPFLPIEPVRPIKKVRTRSGRVTKPPQYIQDELNETSADITINSDFIQETETSKSIEEPEKELKINVDDNILYRKRTISSQFRCPKCNKAYLGRNKMLAHLEKHPDHGPVPDFCKIKYSDTWNYLIDVCNKYPSGKKGFKFCEELVTFLDNLKVLAKLFFKKPSVLDKNLYYVDNVLSGVLGINPGKYVLKENQLHNDVEKCGYIHNNFEVNNKNNDNVTSHNINDDKENIIECDPNNTSATNDLNNSKISLNKSFDFETVSKLDINQVVFSPANSDIKSNNSVDTPDQIMGNFCDVIENVDEKSKCVDLPVSELDRLTSSDLSLNNELLTDSLIMNSLPNLRTSVDDLILNQPIANMLDNSASSDEVMNVDQFVNERLKNLTESDLQLPNNSLNLDLQSMDLFQFNPN